MNVKRTAVIGAGCGALAVWLSAAATSNLRTPVPLAVPRPAAIDIGGAALNAEIARLHERLRPTTPPVKSRDLFRYGGRTARSAGAAAALNPAIPAPEPLLPNIPIASAIRLIGVAEDAGADGAIRTAIISAQGELFLGKEGETIATRYRIVSISPSGAEVTDLADNSTLRLALK